MSTLNRFTNQKNTIEAGHREMEAFAVYLEDTKLLPSPTTVHASMFKWSIDTSKGHCAISVSSYGSGYCLSVSGPNGNGEGGSEMSFAAMISKFKRVYESLNQPTVQKSCDDGVSMADLHQALEQLNAQPS